MEKLVGLETTHPTNNQPEITIQPEPQEIQTKQPLSSSPFAKLGLVGAGTLAIVLVAGVFLSQLMNPGNQKPNKTITSQPQPTLQPSPRKLESEVEDLKTKLALTEQAQAVKAAQQKLRNPIPVSPKSTPQTPLTNRVRVSLADAPRTNNYIPPRISQPQPERIRIVRVPVLQPQPPRPQPTAKPTAKPTIQATPLQTLDSLQDLVKLAELNDYYKKNSVASNTPIIQPTPTPTLPVIPLTPTPIITPTPTPTIAATPTPTPVQKAPKSVAVGSKVKAVFATAVFGETTRSTNSDKNDTGKPVFVVRLREPLKSTDDKIALPVNTELVAEIRSISEQGLLQLNVTKLVTRNGNTISEKTLPENAMIIRAREGKPLIANQYPNRGGSIASMDAGLFVLGGLGKAAELVNRNESQFSITTNGTTISNNNSRRNILAGVAEGGISTIVPQIAQRNQQAISQMTQRSNIWYLAAGKEVEVYVNQTMEF
jgi:Bacterial conjugation TrbI-like protein